MKMKNTIALIGDGYWGSKIKNYIPKENLKYVANSKFKLNTIWRDSKVKGVIIATPLETHYNIAECAILAKKHVFIEKPITVTSKEAVTLKTLADSNNVKIGVNYVQTFSKSVKKCVSLVDEIGTIKFIEMSTKHLGRFMNFDVFYLLASHHLSILDMIIDINKLCFNFITHDSYKNLATSGSIVFNNNQSINDLTGRIDVSLQYPGKEMYINLYGDKGTIKYTPLESPSVSLTLYNKNYAGLPPELTEKEKTWNFDENNNLKYAIQYFDNIIEGIDKSNYERAFSITNILSN